jgi:hypothetical protein
MKDVTMKKTYTKTSDTKVIPIKAYYFEGKPTCCTDVRNKQYCVLLHTVRFGTEHKCAMQNSGEYLENYDLNPVMFLEPYEGCIVHKTYEQPDDEQKEP